MRSSKAARPSGLRRATGRNNVRARRSRSGIIWRTRLKRLRWQSFWLPWDRCFRGWLLRRSFSSFLMTCYRFDHINLSVRLEVFSQFLRPVVRCCHFLQAPPGGRWSLVAVEARVASSLAAIAKALGYISVISFSSDIPRLADATNSANLFKVRKSKGFGFVSRFFGYFFSSPSQTYDDERPRY